MKYLKTFEKSNIIDDKPVSLLLLPSGEILRLTEDEFLRIDEYMILDYDSDMECYQTDDHLRDSIIMILN